MKDSDKEKIKLTPYELIGIMVLVMILTGVITLIGLGFTKFKVEEIIPRNETFIKTETCEIWQICDYRTQWPCFTDCEEEYECWMERRNCDS